jgi:hypothetical protein
MVEMESMISNQLVSILIDLGSNLSYVAPKIVEKCKLEQLKHAKSWLVQRATGTKIKVIVGTGADPGSTLQQCTNKTLTTGPFSNTCEADEVSSKVEAGVVVGLKCLQP